MTIDWLVRYAHVLSAAIWTGGYVVLLLLLYPLLGREDRVDIARIAVSVVRMLTFAGTSTFVFGLLLITRSRGFGQVLDGEWGYLIIASAVIAVAVLGIGDSALRPALRRIAEGGEASSAQRLILVALALLVLATGLMTRAVFANS